MEPFTTCGYFARSWLGPAVIDVLDRQTIDTRDFSSRALNDRSTMTLRPGEPAPLDPTADRYARSQFVSDWSRSEAELL